MPPEDMRLHDEEIKSAVEYERETLGVEGGKKKLSTIKEEDEFMFDNSRSLGKSDRTKSGMGSTSSDIVNFSENEQHVWF